jgi:hypothetical protein
MRYVITRFAIAAVLVGAGWAAGTARTSPPQFTMEIESSAYENAIKTTVICVRGCALRGARDQSNPNAGLVNQWQYSCSGSESATRTCKGRVNGWTKTEAAKHD